MYTSLPSLWSLPPTHPHPGPEGHHRAPGWAPVLCSSFPPAVYFTRSSMCMSMPLSQVFPPSSPLTVSPSLPLRLPLYSAPQIGSSVPLLSIPYICVNIRYSFFFFWLIPLCITSSTRLIHLTPTNSNLFFFMAEKYFIVYMYRNFFIHPSVKEIQVASMSRLL